MSSINVPETLQFLRELNGWLESNHSQENQSQRYWEAEAWVTTDQEVKKGLIPLRQITDRVAPELTDLIDEGAGSYSWKWTNVSDVVIQLIGVLDQDERLRAMLGPLGPTIAASKLHPWVWEASARLWDDQHRKMAIQAAATAIELQLKAKLGVDRSGTDLVTRAFNVADPKPGEPRLRFPGFDTGTESWTSMHEGAMSYARACMMAIRNLATHESDEPDAQVALEQLAALSVLARWIDEAEVVSIA